MFVSTHGYGTRERGVPANEVGAFYPGSGRTEIPDEYSLREGSAGSEARVAENMDTAEMDASFGPMQKGHLFLRSLLQQMKPGGDLRV